MEVAVSIAQEILLNFSVIMRKMQKYCIRRRLFRPNRTGHSKEAQDELRHIKNEHKTDSSNRIYVLKWWRYLFDRFLFISLDLCVVCLANRRAKNWKTDKVQANERHSNSFDSISFASVPFFAALCSSFVRLHRVHFLPSTSFPWAIFISYY